MQNQFSKDNSVVMKSTFNTAQKTNSNKPRFQFNVTVSLTALIALLLTFYVNVSSQDTFFDPIKILPTENNIPFKPFKAKSIGNGVNVRSEPTLNSNTVHNKVYKETILDVIERSIEESKINIKGELQTDYWYKVEFIYKENGKELLGEGWVYGYFIQQVRNPDVA